jgi:hypothetical protein
MGNGGGNRSSDHPISIPVASIPEYSIANLAKPYIGPNSFLNRVASLKRRTPPNSQTNTNNTNNTNSSDRGSKAGAGAQTPTGASTNANNNNNHADNKGYVKTNSLAHGPINTSNSEFLASRRDAIVIPGLFNASTSVYNGGNGSPTSNDHRMDPSPTPEGVPLLGGETLDGMDVDGQAGD